MDTSEKSDYHNHYRVAHIAPTIIVATKVWSPQRFTRGRCPNSRHSVSISGSPTTQPPPSSVLSPNPNRRQPLPSPSLPRPRSSLPDRSLHLLPSRSRPPPPQIRLDPAPPRLEPPPPTSFLLPLTPPPARMRPTVLSPATSAAPRSGEGSQAAGMPAQKRPHPSLNADEIGRAHV